MSVLAKSGRWSLRLLALGYLLFLLLVPLLVIVYRSFAPGWSTWWSWITTPAALSALTLSLLIVAIVVPLNVVFGFLIAHGLAHNTLKPATLINRIIDLPFAVSPVIVGVALIALWGRDGWFGGIEQVGIKVIFGFTGLVLATLLVTLPFVVREVEPVLREIGPDQEHAAQLLGANSWQIFRRITIPSVRWAITYGAVLTAARALGEYGAVTLVSSNFPGISQTLTLLVSARYSDDYNTYGAYAAATLLIVVAVGILLVLRAVGGVSERESKEFTDGH